MTTKRRTTFSRAQPSHLSQEWARGHAQGRQTTKRTTAPHHPLDSHSTGLDAASRARLPSSVLTAAS